MKPTEDLAALRLYEIVAQLRSVALAYSGGTDSTYLLAVCLDLLGPDKVLALTADSTLTARAELAEARELAVQLGARHRLLSTDDLADQNIAANPPDRCYHCKFTRFSALLEVARSEGLSVLLHGENADDATDYRPGSRAAEELGVRAPLREAGLTKADVRRLSRARGLPNWNKPANACLASRFPYGTALTPEGLARVESAEAVLRKIWDLDQLRVRDLHPLARIEVPPDEIARIAHPDQRADAVEALHHLGYRYIALDLDGYRMGSLNDVLELRDQ
jgi:uncharacterized protein